jgi:hypothetical protein
MHKTSYERIIQDLCREVDIPDWQSIAVAQHIEVEGIATGILYDECAPTEALSLYFDFETVVHDVAVLARHFQYNATNQLNDGGTGYFCQLPASQSLVYRVNVAWAETPSGAQVLEKLVEHLQIARQAMDECSRA